MAEPLPVYVKHPETGTESAVGYACSVCKIFHSPAIYLARPEVADRAARDSADRCCDRKCEDCDEKLEKQQPYTCCASCRAKREAAREASIYEKATKVPEAEYQGPVFAESGEGGNEGYFRDLGELRDYFDDEDLPDWVWACTAHGLGKLDADSIIESALSDHHEDAADWLEKGATEALQTMLDQWVATYASDVETWEVDHERVVVLQKKEIKADESKAEEGAGAPQEGVGDAGNPEGGGP